jgi:hypothetical protein
MRFIHSSCSADAVHVVRAVIARLLLPCLLLACDVAPDKISVPIYTPPMPPDNFVCLNENTRACVGNKHYSCTRDDEFLQSHMIDCAATDQICIVDIGCSICRADDRRCRGNDIEICRDGTRWEQVDGCDVAAGLACDVGYCVSMCEMAKVERSYTGCEFYAVDLDNAALSEIDDASSQQFAVAVSNPQTVATRVTVEINRAPVGEPEDVIQVASVIGISEESHEHN